MALDLGGRLWLNSVKCSVFVAVGCSLSGERVKVASFCVQATGYWVFTIAFSESRSGWIGVVGLVSEGNIGTGM